MTQVIRLFAYLVAMRLVVCLLVCWLDASEFGFGVCMLLLRIAWRVGWVLVVLEFGCVRFVVLLGFAFIGGFGRFVVLFGVHV